MDSTLPASPSPSNPLERLIAKQIQAQGGWLPFDRYMALALYAPGLGYYSRESRKFGHLPSSGSDFVTAPELSPLFGRCLARQVQQALAACGSSEVWEFGAGSGALALQLLEALGEQVEQYTIIELSGSLRQQQRAVLAPYENKVRWLDTWPEQFEGVVIGNEVLDAMPVQLLHFDGQQWLERGVVLDGRHGFAWSDRPTALRPPVDVPFAPGTITEIHAQAEGFMASLAERLTRGAAFFIDYGFPQAEYYHLERTGGTLMCHRAHLADANPLEDPGEKDITAHVNFTGIALTAQNAGLDVLGYTSQARFLMNCGVMQDLENADLKQRANAQKLLTEHEMGELFKVLGLAKGCEAGFNQNPLGFVEGDRTHTL
ncbi:MAG: class I SAM-dependent methyltransferase [Burkholderiales bacterium]